MSNEVVEHTIKGPHARRRFTKQLAKVELLLREASGLARDDLPGQVFFQSDGRTPMFMLQALGRVYEKLDLSDKLFATIRLESKIVEDALGQIDFWNVISRKCTEWSLPAGVQQLARLKYVETCGRVWSWIESQDWVANRYHPDAELLPQRFIRKLKKVDWDAPHREAKAIKKWLVKELHIVHDNIQELDLNQIEAGLHKARREVRWLSIYFTAVEGGFVLDRDAEPPPNWDRYLTKEIVENPFNRLPDLEDDDVPIHVPAPLLFALSYAIEQLGVIKDCAQWTEALKHLLHLSGEKAALPELMGKNYLEDADATRQGAELIEQVFVKDQVLLRLAEGIKT